MIFASEEEILALIVTSLAEYSFLTATSSNGAPIAAATLSETIFYIYLFFFFY
jgi:hypothetical protein